MKELKGIHCILTNLIYISSYLFSKDTRLVLAVENLEIT